MKPTTTWVFVSPVRPQISQSQIIQGLFESAAGAHRSCLPTAQEGQAKSLPEMAGGSPGIFSGYRLFLLLLINMLTCQTVYAGKTAQSPVSDSPPITQQATAPALVPIKDACNSSDPNAAPAMVAIRPGRFKMGSPESEQGRTSDESPQHQVTIPKPFAISRCEITVGQFKQFIQESKGYKTTAETDGKGCYVWNAEKNDWQQQVGKYWNNPGFTQTDEHPMVCVSWSDAQRYVDWLSQRTGAVYRLPTEAEWEYAARADTQTAFFWGNDENKAGDFAWFVQNSGDKTQPVGGKKPNAFGLYDTAGNVWEWTQDCWHEDYKLAPNDGSAWLETQAGNCDRRVVRGGSWYFNPRSLRSAFRFRYFNEAYLSLGFRIARAL